MLIEILDRNRCEIFISGDELERYRVDFEKIDARAPETRKLLEDVLGSLKNIGMRQSGETAAIGCSRLGGGCLLKVSFSREVYRFSSRSDLDAALRAGLTEISRGSILPDGGGFLLSADISDARKPLLTEFCRKITAD